ncbi:hypothetical protein GMMP15_2100005 [Candidatus Magnetomoraceae bacterium gMMP-15]
MLVFVANKDITQHSGEFDLNATLLSNGRDLPSKVRYQQVTEQGTLSNRLEAIEQEMILSALEKSKWVQTKAAKSLGINERVLRYRMKKYNIKKN